MDENGNTVFMQHVLANDYGIPMDITVSSYQSADFQKIWTYMGLPAISLPLLTGENDLPLGVQLVGDKLDDLRFLGTANWLEKNCKDE